MPGDAEEAGSPLPPHADPGEALKAFNNNATTNSLAIVAGEDGKILYRKKYGSRREIEAKIEEALSD